MRVLVLRDRKESPRKCSLTPLRGRADVSFLEWRGTTVLDARGMTLLQVDAPPLSRADAGGPVLLLDCSWKKVERMRKCLRGDPTPRSIPAGFVTVYPRKSKTFEDPGAGLASVEALYIASVVLGEEDRSLLDGYLFGAAFLERNREALARGRAEGLAGGFTSSSTAGAG
ncbi:MAG TPA: hypothetical protein VKF62_01230 [Planctomycetota bacterium]|nr:hypothetical protein [Planctomycetota bacterium]